MKNKVSLFIDETSHLEHDGHYNMCLGYIKVPDEKYDSIRRDFQQLKLKHHSPFELKWNKFSRSRLDFYKALVDFFFEKELFFRCVLVKPKERLDHLSFNDGSHDSFYYKMIYFLIKPSVKDQNARIFLDIKDTRSREKLNKIIEIYKNEMKTEEPFRRIQHLRSEDNVFIQLADFFIGAISYNSRALNEGSFKFHPAKKEFIKYLEEKSGFNLDDGTPPWEEKFNVFDFQPRKTTYK